MHRSATRRGEGDVRCGASGTVEVGVVARRGGVGCGKQLAAHTEGLRDGAFGNEQCPADLETIADEQKIPLLLKKRGYSEEDINKVMHGNWLRFLRRVWI